MNYTELRRLIQIQKQGGASLEEAQKFIGELVKSNGYMPVEQAYAEVELLFHSSRQRSISQELSDWLLVTSGYFSVTSCYKELQAVTKQDKSAIRTALHRLVEAKYLVRHSTRDGLYRRAETSSQDIDWKNADPTKTLPLAFPFGLEKFMDCLRQDIYVVAGVKSSGKTSFAHNFIKMNQNNPDLPQPIFLFSSEGSAQTLHKRLRAHDDMGIDDWTFRPKRKTTDFADAIVKDHINIIDYLEPPGGEYKLMVEEIRRIYENLGDGIALICLQKDYTRDIARGGYGTIEKASLYLVLDRLADGGEVATVKECKNWKGKSNPYGLKIYYKVAQQGAKLIKLREQWRTPKLEMGED
mgnify:CR=1 FL=1